MTSKILTHLFYFNPLTQKHSESHTEPSVYVHMNLPEGIPLERLKEIIQGNGNYITLYTIKTVFKRQLSEEEMAECNELDKRLCPYVDDTIYSHLVGTEIAQANMDQVSRIIASVRTAIQNLKSK